MTFLPQNWQGTETYHSDTFTLDGLQWYVSAEYDNNQRPGEPSFSYDAGTGEYTFRVKDGDRFTSNRFSDTVGSERAEISMSTRYNIGGNGKYVSARGKFMIPSGVPANTASWMSILQYHSGINRSGPFDMGPRGSDVLKAVVRNSAGETVYNLTSGNMQRDHWYDLKVDIKFDPSTAATGYCHVWLDGVLVLDLNNIRIGYTDQTTTHNNLGCYRNSPPGTGETWVIKWKDIDVTFSADLANSNHGAPGTPTPPTWEPPSGANIIMGTTGNDTISGTSGQDAIYGNGGSNVFILNGPLNGVPDYFMDFNPATDKFAFINTVFTSLWAMDPIGADTFQLGTTSSDHNNHVLYDSATGQIWYDPDGNGTAAKVLIAKVQPGTTLAYTNFKTLTAIPTPATPRLTYNQSSGELFYDDDTNSGGGAVLVATYPAGTPIDVV